VVVVGTVIVGVVLSLNQHDIYTADPLKKWIDELDVAHRHNHLVHCVLK
jgi:hypothetical protein